MIGSWNTSELVNYIEYIIHIINLLHVCDNWKYVRTTEIQNII